MIPPPLDNDFEAPNRSLSARVATWLERACFLSARVAIPGMVITGGMFLLYVIVETLTTITGFWTPPYPFLSPIADPYFAILSFLVGLNVCVGTGAIIIFYMMHGVETTRSQIATLAAFIGFGFGASVVRIMLPTVLQLITAG